MAFRRFAVDHGILLDTLMDTKDDKQAELIVGVIYGLTFERSYYLLVPTSGFS